MIPVPDHCQAPDCREPVLVGIGAPDEGVVWVCSRHFAEAMKAVGERVSFLARRIAAAAGNGGPAHGR
jgi:hypothetical protein